MDNVKEFKIEKTNTLPFIKTSDHETMNLLKVEGFELIDYSNGIWTFLNCPNKNINFENKKNIAYSNMLCI